MNVKKTASLVGVLGILIASCTSGEGGGDQHGADLILSGAKYLRQIRNSPGRKLWLLRMVDSPTLVILQEPSRINRNVLVPSILKGDL